MSPRFWVLTWFGVQLRVNLEANSFCEKLCNLSVIKPMALAMSFDSTSWALKPSSIIPFRTVCGSNHNLKYHYFWNVDNLEEQNLRITYIEAWFEYGKTEVSLNELHRIIEDTLADEYSANFCERNPPRAEPNMWTLFNWSASSNLLNPLHHSLIE